MIQLAHDTPAEVARGHMPALLDFCGAWERRNERALSLGPWHLVSPDVGAAVGAHRAALKLTLRQAAGAAGVGHRVFARIEQPSGRRLERAFPVWRVLTWVMATGGPAFCLEG